MKLLFLVFHNLIAHSGISKKIYAQCSALKENGVDVSLCTLEIAPDGTKYRTVDSIPICSFGSGLKAKLRKRIDYSDIVKHAVEGRYDAVYIRYDFNSDPFTIRMMDSLKRNGIKSVVEIPTYPYDAEFKGQGVMMNATLLVDKIFRKRFFSLCDHIVLYSGPDTLYGRPVIHISNGIDFSCVPLSCPQTDFTGKLRMVSVANIHNWHGLDRLIKGMALHSDVPCELHIIGDGIPQIIDSYRDMAREYGIGDRVKILGPMYGESLDKEFEWANIAVGSLARHRSGITSIKTLKNREYAARGLSFFYSEQDDDFDSAPYVFKVPADESAIDVGKVAEFLSGMNLPGSSIRESITHLSWRAQMAKVIEQIS